MSPDLGTTNIFLGIMAAGSVLQMVAVVGLFAGAFTIYRRFMHVLAEIEQRQVEPAVARVNAILDDVKGVTSAVKKETGHIERLVEWMFEAIGHPRRRAHEEPRHRVM
jgi:hypothetical protein